MESHQGKKTHVVVVGAGSFGTSLALTLHRAGNDVTLITRNEEQSEAMHHARENTTYLPGIPIPSGIKISAFFPVDEPVAAVVLAVPTSYVRSVFFPLPISYKTPVIIASKGFEVDPEDPSKTILLSETITTLNPQQVVAVLSGPNFAKEIALNLPTATTIACDSMDPKELCALFNHPYFRCYATNDVVGVQVAGAVKNIIAIACGIAKGLKLGDNAVSTLIARGLAEIKRLGLAMGAKTDTFLGLSGVGDLTLTATSLQSRNTQLGFFLAQGETLKTLLDEKLKTVEGYHSSRVISLLAKEKGVSMPICSIVNKILHEGVPLSTAIEELLSTQYRVNEHE